jgi:hypothetical protein
VFNQAVVTLPFLNSARTLSGHAGDDGEQMDRVHWLWEVVLESR